MCSVVEIKTPNEIYIHYLSQNCSDEEDQSDQNIRLITIKDKVDSKGMERKPSKCYENGSNKLVNITHIKKGGVENKSSDIEVKDVDIKDVDVKDVDMKDLKDDKDDDQTSDRASSMGSSTIDSVEIYEKVDVTVNSLTILPIGAIVETCEIATQVDQELGDDSGETLSGATPCWQKYICHKASANTFSSR